MDGLTMDRHKVIPALDWSDLTDEEKKEFDWEGAKDTTFFRYLANTYSDEDFMYSHDPDWDGYLSDTFFSGVFVAFEIENGEIEKLHCMRYFS